MTAPGLARFRVLRTFFGRLPLDALSQGPWFWSCWYLASLTLILLVPSYWRLNQHFWNLSPSEAAQSFAIGIVYLGLALSVRMKGSRSGHVSMLLVLGGGILAFMICRELLAYWQIPASRLVFLSGAALSVLMTLLPLVVGRYRVPALALLTFGTVTVVTLDLPAREMPEPAGPGVHVANRYSIQITAYPDLVPPSQNSGGAIATDRDGFMVVTGAGEFYRLSWEPTGSGLESQAVPLSAPSGFNWQEFLADQEPTERFQPAPTAEFFRITDLLLEETSEATRAYLVHDHWNSDERCITLQVSSVLLETGSSATETLTQWETIFESQPCLDFGPEYPAWPQMNGGRLASHPRGLMLTVGDYGVSGLDGGAAIAQEPGTSYGKILILESDGNWNTFSTGHRNPQGLLVDDEGRIWSTEHGPQGGDELNVIADGDNYGWPLVTYGTDYGRDHWPLSPDSVDHETFHEPALAFVPSIGISQLIQLGAEHYPAWAGDLLVASLGEDTMFRIRPDGERVVYAEPIPVGVRTRDLEEGSDGRIVVWTKDGQVLSLTRAQWEDSGQALFEGLCGRCHETGAGETGALGPSLLGVAGRPVASEGSYAYSNTLRQLGGVWTQERLESFLADPTTFAPGTTMQIGVPDPIQRQALVEFLATYE